MVALYSGDLKLYSDTSSITPTQSSSDVRLIEYMFSTLGHFLQVET